MACRSEDDTALRVLAFLFSYNIIASVEFPFVGPATKYMVVLFGLELDIAALQEAGPNGKV